MKPLLSLLPTLSLFCAGTASAQPLPIPLLRRPALPLKMRSASTLTAHGRFGVKNSPRPPHLSSTGYHRPTGCREVRPVAERLVFSRDTRRCSDCARL